MRLFKQNSTDQPSSEGTARPAATPQETAAAQQDSTPEASVTATSTAAATAPAAWYPDPEDPTVLRYWDGSAWTEQRRGIPPPPVPQAAKPRTAPADAAATAFVAADTTAPKPAVDEPKPAAAVPITVAPTTQNGFDVATWVGETEKAVTKAREVGTPGAWQDAAHAARVVSEIAQTLQVMTNAHQIAEQRTQSAEAATRQATLATHAADEAKRKAEQTGQAAEQAAQVARAAAKAADEAKRTAEQTALMAPRAVESAHLATQAAVDARSTADQLDQLVSTARKANTPQAWSEALQIASAIWASETGPKNDVGRWTPSTEPKPDATDEAATKE
jgi:hypothetical protein